MPHASTWLKVLPSGLFCEPGGFFIDPLRPVDRAVITHGHSDHARAGHRAVLATADTLAIMRARLGDDGATHQALGWHEPITLGEVRVWLSPAGHVLGSAQVAMDYRGSLAVVSGDYKRVADPTCAGFEPVPCDVFVTEATFALPVFVHPPPSNEIKRLLDSVALFPERTHVVGCYALGKSQRLIALLRQAGWDGPIWLHGALVAMCEVYRQRGAELGDLRPATMAAKAELVGAIVLAPPGAIADRWARRLEDPVVALASGLDARPPAGKIPWGGAAAGDLGPRRLERVERNVGRGRRARGLGYARARGSPDPRRHPAWHEGPRTSTARLRRRG